MSTETKVTDMTGTRFFLVIVLGIIVATLAIAGVNYAWNNHQTSGRIGH